MSTKISTQSNCNQTREAFELDESGSITEAIFQPNTRAFCKPLDTCDMCEEPLQEDIEILGVLRRMPVICKCRADELRKKREREEFRNAQRGLDKFKSYSLMDKRFEKSTFENWELREDNQSLYEFGKAYCENWESVKANNRGLLVHGASGNGKTYLSFAIANELYKNNKSVLAISVSRILKIITDSYRQSGEVGEMDVLNTLHDASLLILDDLGVESKTYWAYEKLYSIIDARYRAKKPIIITTNLSIEELRSNLATVDVKSGAYDQSGRIYNRIVEMCALIKVNGESWRLRKGEENKKALFRDLGLLSGDKNEKR